MIIYCLTDTGYFATAFDLSSFLNYMFEKSSFVVDLGLVLLLLIEMFDIYWTETGHIGIALVIPFFVIYLELDLIEICLKLDLFEFHHWVTCYF